LCEQGFLQPLVLPSDGLMLKRILIVDDSAPTRGLIRTFIESRPGFEVCGEAVDGFEGIQKTQELMPDLIVLDYSMPRINGLQAAVILHEIVPNTPIILFTFYKGVIPARLAQDAGVASIISKGDQLDNLADEVQRLTAGPN
jgi:two-component system nitrate/nitrite response regulator NarL